MAVCHAKQTIQIHLQINYLQINYLQIKYLQIYCLHGRLKQNIKNFLLFLFCFTVCFRYPPKTKHAKACQNLARNLFTAFVHANLSLVFGKNQTRRRLEFSEASHLCNVQ